MSFLFGASKDGGSRRHERALARTITKWKSAVLCYQSRGSPGRPQVPECVPKSNYEANTRKLRKRTENRPQMFGIDRPAKQWVVAINVFDQPFSDWTIIF